MHAAELGAYAALGIIGGVISVVFCRTLLRVRRATLTLSATGKVFLPAAGGALVGLIIIAVPQVMGVGYESSIRPSTAA
jgi:CIC family chloride channel protein